MGPQAALSSSPMRRCAIPAADGSGGRPLEGVPILKVLAHRRIDASFWLLVTEQAPCRQSLEAPCCQGVPALSSALDLPLLDRSCMVFMSLTLDSCSCCSARTGRAAAP